jgi:hypothetical protein
MQHVLPACSAYAELKLQSVQLEDPAFASAARQIRGTVSVTGLNLDVNPGSEPVVIGI